MKTKEEIIQTAKISNKEKEIAQKFGAEILIKGITIYPVTCYGSGRWSKNYRLSTVQKEIDLLKSTELFNYEEGNNAPRGGATGEYHKFTPKIKRLGLLRKINELKEIEKQKIAKKQKEDNDKFNELLKVSPTAIDEWKIAVKKYGNPYWAAQKLTDEAQILIQDLYQNSNMSWRQLFSNL